MAATQNNLCMQILLTRISGWSKTRSRTVKGNDLIWFEIPEAKNEDSHSRHPTSPYSLSSTPQWLSSSNANISPSNPLAKGARILMETGHLNTSPTSDESRKILKTRNKNIFKNKNMARNSCIKFWSRTFSTKHEHSEHLANQDQVSIWDDLKQSNMLALFHLFSLTGLTTKARVCIFIIWKLCIHYIALSNQMVERNQMNTYHYRRCAKWEHFILKSTHTSCTVYTSNWYS